MPQTSNSICDNCANFFIFSSEEKKLLEGSFSQNSIQISTVKGVCIRGQDSNSVFIHRILFFKYPLKNCEYLITGNKIFQTLFRCPICSDRLFVKNETGNKTFYCKRCNKYSQMITITTNCRFCYKPLSLEAGEVFRCECKKCGKGIDIPILPQVYPSVNPKNELCVHGKKIEDCGICLPCSTNRSNILFHEICVSFNKQKELAKEKRLSYEKYIKTSKGLPRHLSKSELEFTQEDELETYFKFDPPKNRIADWSDSIDDIEDWSDDIDIEDSYPY